MAGCYALLPGLSICNVKCMLCIMICIIVMSRNLNHGLGSPYARLINKQEIIAIARELTLSVFDKRQEHKETGGKGSSLWKIGREAY